ncbi:dephospho-CoA kinase [Leucobacter coleopterorum]|uniref:Dephospho-CoA kinase n=1 Tax=Leucobacter coleopterorum TaxID=2714933 RepID=A0ABX6JXN7_9MICO|nr:dephospho-CoA kinase [Leucobacter coleopterorum]QIM18368.1 dephospho-CoA kinase [Leucobacter coleopterorum]
MTLIALTGGIASGKSTIGARLAELGAMRIDADQLARDAVAVGSPGLARVVEQFGDGVLQSDGSLDRAVLGSLVFSDPQSLAKLNGIVHPEVQRLADERIAEARAADPAAVVVYEIPLLVETLDERASNKKWDLVVVADAPVEQRVQRMVTLRGMTEQDANTRVSNQASDAERRAIADVIIDTSGSKEETLAQVEALWKRLTVAN